MSGSEQPPSSPAPGGEPERIPLNLTEPGTSRRRGCVAVGVSAGMPSSTEASATPKVGEEVTGPSSTAMSAVNRRTAAAYRPRTT